jgi:hypothetical protein
MRTEDDIRAAFRQAAEHAPAADAVLAEVREQLDKGYARPSRDGRRGLRTPMAAVASAVAVMAVIGGSIALADGGHAPHRAAAIGGHAPHRAIASAGWPGVDVRNMGPGGAPPYYLTLINNRTGPDGYAAVVDTATGARLATLRPPKPFHTFDYVIGAADDRTFVLEAQRTAGDNATTLFRAQIDPSRRSVTLTALPIPPIRPDGQVNGLALSPDGSRLAVLMRLGGYQQLSVYSMTSGAVKVWRQPGTAMAYWPSWGRGGILAFTWRSGVWLLNTATAGGGLIANSRLAVAESHGWNFIGDLLTPDGRTVVAAQLRYLHPGAKDEFAEYSAKTGRQIEALWPVHDGFEDLGWASPSGNVLIVEVYAKNREVLGTLSGGRLTTILSQAVGSSGPLDVFPGSMAF